MLSFFTRILYNPVIQILFILIILVRCDDYQDEDYDISSLDSKACNLLSIPDSLGILLEAAMITDVDSTWSNDDLNDIATLLKDELLSKQIIVNETDSNKYSISLSALSDTQYVCLSTNSPNIVIYLDDFPVVNIYDDSGMIIKPDSYNIPLETIFYTTVTEPDEWDASCEHLKVRIEHSISGADYIMQLVRTDQMTTPDKLSLLVLRNR